MLREDSDIDPDDPDHYQQVFVPGDRKKWNSNNPQHVAEHDKAQEAFEARKQTRTNMSFTSKYVFFGAVLKQTDASGCQCSYCGRNGYDTGMKPGLNIPSGWRASNAWFVWARFNADGTK